MKTLEDKPLFCLGTRLGVLYFLGWVLVLLDMPMEVYNNYYEAVFWAPDAISLAYGALLIGTYGVLKWLGAFYDGRPLFLGEANHWLEGAKERRLSSWLGLFLLFSLLIILLSYLEGSLVAWLGVGQAENELLLEEMEALAASKTWNDFSVIVQAPIFEELIYRRILFALFFPGDRWRDHILSVVFSGLVFGLIHEPALSWNLVFYMVPGMVFAAAYRYSKDLRLPIALHMLNNFIATI
ncbi:MAG: CPBP family intramembrane metalloprotease [Tissierellia bacterium]|nr:CPBP family intramembrane metalloprotease [Tissierellia bacterium]